MELKRGCTTCTHQKICKLHVLVNEAAGSAAGEVSPAFGIDWKDPKYDEMVSTVGNALSQFCPHYSGEG